MTAVSEHLDLRVKRALRPIPEIELNFFREMSAQ